jgi:HEAT repeat protein
MLADKNRTSRAAVARRLKQVRKTPGKTSVTNKSVTTLSKISSLTAALKAKHADILAAGRIVNALARLKDPKVVPILIGVLNDSKYDFTVRSNASAALVAYYMADPRSMPALFAILSDAKAPFWLRRWTLLSMQGVSDPKAAKNILPYLSHPCMTKYGRALAAEMLGSIRNPIAVPHLIKTLNDTEEIVRIASVYALGNIGDPRAVLALIAATMDPSSGVRLGAVRALGAMKDPHIFPALKAALSDTDDDVRRAALRCLGGLNDPRVQPILMKAIKSNDSELQREAASIFARRKDVGAVKILLGLLKNSPIYDVRLAAADALWELKKTGRAPQIPSMSRLRDLLALPDYIKELKDSDDPRTGAVWDLYRIKDPRVVPALIAALKNKGSYIANAEVRREAAKALCLLKDRRAVPALIAALKDDWAHIDAAKALGKIKDIRAVPYLIAWIKDGSRETWTRRITATVALGNIGDVRAVPALKALLRKDLSPLIRYRAKQALSKIEPSIYQTKALSKTGVRVLELVEALRDGSSDNYCRRRDAIEELDKIAEASQAKPAIKVLLKKYAVPALKGLIKNDLSDVIRLLAKYAICAINGTSCSHLHDSEDRSDDSSPAVLL